MPNTRKWRKRSCSTSTAPFVAACCSDRILSDKKGSSSELPFLWLLFYGCFFMPVEKLLHSHGDFLRNDRRIERHVTAVAQFELQSVLARCQFDGGLGLRLAEVHVVGICRNRCAFGRQLVDIDQQVMVTRVFGDITSRGK